MVFFLCSINFSFSSALVPCDVLHLIFLCTASIEKCVRLQELQNDHKPSLVFLSDDILAPLVPALTWFLGAEVYVLQPWLCSGCFVLP